VILSYSGIAGEWEATEYYPSDGSAFSYKVDFATRPLNFRLCLRKNLNTSTIESGARGSTKTFEINWWG